MILASLIANKEFEFELADMKQFMRQLLNGLFYFPLIFSTLGG